MRVRSTRIRCLFWFPYPYVLRWLVIREVGERSHNSPTSSSVSSGGCGVCGFCGLADEVLRTRSLLQERDKRVTASVRKFTELNALDHDPAAALQDWYVGSENAKS